MEIQDQSLMEDSGTFTDTTEPKSSDTTEEGQGPSSCSEAGAGDSASEPPPAQGAATEALAVAAPSSFVCKYCGKGPFKSRAGLASHERWCKAKPKADKAGEALGPVSPPETPDRPKPVKLESLYSPEPQRPATAAHAAQAAQDAIIGDPELLESAAGGDLKSAGKLIGRLSAGKVGVPELSALACQTALPPPLAETEYQALCAVWGEDDLDIPPGVLKFLVTASIFGPRLMQHPQIGPSISSLGKRLAERAGLIEQEKPAQASRTKPRPEPRPEPQRERTTEPKQLL